MNDNTKPKLNISKIRSIVEDVLTTALDIEFIDIELTKLSRQNSNVVIEGTYSGFFEKGTFKIILDSKTLEVIEYEIGKRS